MSGAGEVWSAFTRDPRRPEHAALRASDADREVVQQVLADAYADGRLDRDELDARATDVAGTRLLGELPPIVQDLVPLREAPATPAAGSAPTTAIEVHERAVAKWRSDRRAALWSFFAASVICWTIWFLGSWGPDGLDPSFPWPLLVMLATGLRVGRTQVRRDDIVAAETRRLEKKWRKQLRTGREPDEA